MVQISFLVVNFEVLALLIFRLASFMHFHDCRQKSGVKYELQSNSEKKTFLGFYFIRV